MKKHLPSDGGSSSRELSQLIESFLNTLSHDLRTPLTSIKTALEGLAGGDAEDAERLSGIGRRNVDRVIDVVEKDLDLLRAILGEQVATRRLVELDAFVDQCIQLLFKDGAERVSVENHHRGGVFLFTDPNKLEAIIRSMLGGRGRPQSRKIAVAVETRSGREWVLFDIARAEGDRPAARVPCLPGEPTETGGRGDFEALAYGYLVESLGGRTSSGDAGFRLELPVIPMFDRRKDFALPLERLRRAAGIAGRYFAVLTCKVRDCAERRFSPGEYELFRRCIPILGPWDGLLRDKSRGIYYVVLSGRGPEEIAEITRFIEGPGAPADRRVEVSPLETIRPPVPNPTTVS